MVRRGHPEATVIADWAATELSDEHRPLLTSPSQMNADDRAGKQFMGTNHATDFHDRLLETHRTTPDPDGAILFPPVLASLLPGRWTRRMPRSEFALIRRLGPLHLIRLVVISREAARECTRRFGSHGFFDGLPDAFRHVYWNARLTQRFGPEWTRRFTTAHERLPSADPVPVAMDLHNNELGRRIGAEHPRARRAALASIVEAAVVGGQAVHVVDGLLRRTGL
jgi:hypothetical protein